MKTFFKLFKWDMALLVKYGILPIAVGIGALYVALIYFLEIPSNIISLLIFSDPSMMGFIFVGVMVLFEKQAGTTAALIVTPLRPWQYLLSKSLSLTIPAIVVGMAMAIASNVRVSYPILIIAITLTSVIFLLLGYIGTLRVKTFNQYILIIPLFLAPLNIPLIDYFGLWQTPLMWIFPTKSSLVLLSAAFEAIGLPKILLSLLLLLCFNAILFVWASREYRQRMMNSGE